MRFSTLRNISVTLLILASLALCVVFVSNVSADAAACTAANRVCQSAIASARDACNASASNSNACLGAQAAAGNACSYAAEACADHANW